MLMLRSKGFSNRFIRYHIAINRPTPTCPIFTTKRAGQLFPALTSDALFENGCDVGIKAVLT